MQNARTRQQRDNHQSNDGSGSCSFVLDGGTAVFSTTGGFEGASYDVDLSSVILPNDLAIPSVGITKQVIAGISTTAPTFTLSSGWGSGATANVTMNSNAVRGKVTINSGSGVATATEFGTFTFASAFPSGSEYTVKFWPADANGNNLGLYVGYPTSVGLSSFVQTGSSGMAARIVASTTHNFFYEIQQYK